ncbi:grpE [Symbiodinium sp. CCMP2592]|nr:grpE [Symbiodinium sp. CCMP2592]
MVAASLRRERAMIEEKQEQLQRTAAILSKEKRRIEGELTEQAIELQEFKSKAEATLKAERAALEKEKARLAKESEALALTQQSLMQRAESMSQSAKDADSNEQSLELIEAVRREKAALKRGRQQLRREAEAIAEARRQLEASMDRGQELEELRAKAEALEAEADALRRERTALQKQRARIHAEAEEIAEERESLEKEAKALHRAVARGEEVGKADKDLLAALRAAEQQLAQQTAEFRNFKTRVEQQEKSLGQRALAKAATPLLSVLDDFGRARLAGNSNGEVQAVLRPLRNRLVAVLESEFGVRPMPDTVGQAFNPKLHDAISIRAEDRVPPDTVVEQLEEGFCFGDSDEVLRPAKAAIQKACLEPSFNVNVRSWLRKHQLDSCFDVLAVRGVLESLQLKETFQADATQSLPGRFVDALAKALYEGGDLRRVHGTRQLPDGWEMVYSRSAGLFYYHEIPKGGAQNGRTQWQFPDLQAEFNPPEVPNALTACERGAPCTGVPYVELDSGGEPLCLLCGQRGLEHFAGAAHADKILTWSGIHQRLSQVLRELSAQAMLPASSGGKAVEEDAALAKVWLEEARRAVFDSDAEHQDVEVCRIFWHLLLEPFFKAVRLVSVKEGLDRAIYFSGLPEPKWADMPWRMPLPPRSGQDFTWPYHSSLKLSPSTPREVFNALSAQALLQEGLAPQEGEHRGGLWCSFCCKPVKILQEHLDRTSREAQEHMRAKSSCQAVADKLRVGGWRLRREGLQILKQRFYCGLCNASGSWMQIWDHHRSHHHQNAYMALRSSRSPAALQAHTNNEQFKEAEEKAWQAAFDADRNAVIQV